MKTAVLTAPRSIETRETAVPLIKEPDEVLLKVASIGVCGSDVHYYLHGRIGKQVVKYPFTLGHEFSAFVEETGPAVKTVKPGDLVAIDPARSCGSCDQCLANRSHTCRALTFLGCPGQAEGCLREYITMSEKSCYPANELSPEQACLAEPLSIGLYAVKISSPVENKNIGILGVGPIGLSVLLFAMESGAKKIFATDKIDARTNVAKQAGAYWTGNPEKQDVVRDISETEPHMLDIVFECCGQQEALDQAVKLLKPGGTLSIVGIPQDNRISFLIDDLRHREIKIQNVRRQNGCVQPTLDMMASERIRADFMITHRFNLDDTKKAFDIVAGYHDNVIKAIINP